MPNNNRYDDIIHLPHPVSKKHPPMPRGDRAAQFAPFAALTGYEDAVNETARLTAEKIDLDENEKAALNGKLMLLKAHLDHAPEVAITFFSPDTKKAGGAYITRTGVIKHFDELKKSVVMTDKTVISIDDILSVESEFLKSFE